MRRRNRKKTGAHFAIQILSSKKTVASDSPEFKNYRGKVREYTADGEFRYKYCVCECDTKAEAQQRIEEVRKTFPERSSCAARRQDSKIG